MWKINGLDTLFRLYRYKSFKRCRSEDVLLHSRAAGAPDLIPCPDLPIHDETSFSSPIDRRFSHLPHSDQSSQPQRSGMGSYKSWKSEVSRSGKKGTESNTCPLSIPGNKLPTPLICISTATPPSRETTTTRTAISTPQFSHLYHRNGRHDARYRTVRPHPTPLRPCSELLILVSDNADLPSRLLSHPNHLLSSRIWVSVKAIDESVLARGYMVSSYVRRHRV
jgi:hypothetical protein